MPIASFHSGCGKVHQRVQDGPESTNQPYPGDPPGTDQHPKTGKNQPKIDGKSKKTVFAAKSAEFPVKKMAGNVSDQTDAPNDRDDGKRTNPNQQGPSSAPERGMVPPPTTSSTTSSSSSTGTSTGTRPKTTGSIPKTTKSSKAKKGKKSNSVTEDTNIDSNSEYSSTSEKEDSTNQARFGKLNKVIKELIKIPNPPGGSDVSKEVGGGTGRGEHDSLPKRPPPLWRTH